MIKWPSAPGKQYQIQSIPRKKQIYFERQICYQQLDNDTYTCHKSLLGCNVAEQEKGYENNSKESKSKDKCRSNMSVFRPFDKTGHCRSNKFANMQEQKATNWYEIFVVPFSTTENRMLGFWPMSTVFPKLLSPCTTASADNLGSNCWKN